MPIKINTSARLNENGFLTPQQLKFIKSATEPYKSLSIALPIAPPNTNALDNLIAKFFVYLTHKNKAKDINIEIKNKK